MADRKKRPRSNVRFLDEIKPPSGSVESFGTKRQKTESNDQSSSESGPGNRQILFKIFVTDNKTRQNGTIQIYWHELNSERKIVLTRARFKELGICDTEHLKRLSCDHFALSVNTNTSSKGGRSQFFFTRLSSNLIHFNTRALEKGESVVFNSGDSFDILVTTAKPVKVDLKIRIQIVTPSTPPPEQPVANAPETDEIDLMLDEDEDNNRPEVAPAVIPAALPPPPLMRRNSREPLSEESTGLEFFNTQEIHNAYDSNVVISKKNKNKKKSEPQQEEQEQQQEKKKKKSLTSLYENEDANHGVGMDDADDNVKFNSKKNKSIDDLNHIVIDSSSSEEKYPQKPKSPKAASQEQDRQQPSSLPRTQSHESANNTRVDEPVNLSSNSVAKSKSKPTSSLSLSSSSSSSLSAANAPAPPVAAAAAVDVASSPKATDFHHSVSMRALKVVFLGFQESFGLGSEPPMLAGMPDVGQAERIRKLLEPKGVKCTFSHQALSQSELKDCGLVCLADGAFFSPRWNQNFSFLRRMPMVEFVTPGYLETCALNGARLTAATKHERILDKHETILLFDESGLADFKRVTSVFDKFGKRRSMVLKMLPTPQRPKFVQNEVWDAIVKNRERQVLKDYTEEHPSLKAAASLPVRRAVSLLYFNREKSRDVWLITNDAKVAREAALWQIQAFDGTEFERQFGRYDSFVKDRNQYQLGEMAIWHTDGSLKQN